MKSGKLISFFFIIILIQQTVYCQNNGDSTLSGTAFRRGRTLASIYGNVSSSTSSLIDQVNQSAKFNNGYSFNIVFARFLANRQGLGMLMNISRTGNDDLVALETESFSIGPMYRYYFADKPHGSVFAQTSLYYAGIYKHTYINANVSSTGQLTSGSGQNLSFDQIYRGQGAGVLLGIGYSYTLLDRISFDIGMDYKLAYVDGVLEDLVNPSSVATDFIFRNYTFNFGFVVILDKIRNKK